MESDVITLQPAAQIRFRFHGVRCSKLDELFAHFSPDGYLSAYSYAIVERTNDMTVFDVSYNPETATHHDTMLELALAFRSLGLQFN